MMSGAITESMIGNNRTMPNIKQEVDNPTTPTQNYQVCSPSTTLQHQEVLKLLRELNRLRWIPPGEHTGRPVTIASTLNSLTVNDSFLEQRFYYEYT